jgi:hypothetical protein
MAAILLARRLARGDTFAHGAFPCMGLLKLSEFAPLFARHGISAQWSPRILLQASKTRVR